MSGKREPHDGPGGEPELKSRPVTKYLIYEDLAALGGDDKRPEMTWRDHLAMLLHIGAEIEHSLMVQYLYAAYSLGGEQVPPQHRAMVARWQASILAVAKEERSEERRVGKECRSRWSPY